MLDDLNVPYPKISLHKHVITDTQIALPVPAIPQQLVSLPCDYLIDVVPDFLKDFTADPRVPLSHDEYNNNLPYYWHYYLPTQTPYVFPDNTNYLNYVVSQKMLQFDMYVSGTSGDIPNFLKDKLREIKKPKWEKPFIPKDIEYVLVDEPTFNVSDRCSILNVNIPYELYSKISLSDYIFTYDESQYYAMGKILGDILPHVAEKTFPIIYVALYGRRLVPDNVANLFLLLAKTFKIPQLSFGIVLSNVRIDLVRWLSYNMNDTKDDFTLEEINSICNPYILITDGPSER